MTDISLNNEQPRSNAEVDELHSASSQTEVVESVGQSSTATDTEAPKQLSKNAQKKLAKLQRWEAGREDRLKRNKEKKIAKREAFKTAVANGDIEKPRSKMPQKQEQSGLRVIIDCSFDDLMADREIISMCSQLTRCYAQNRVARHMCRIYMSSWNAKIAHRFQTVFNDQQKSWKEVQTFPEEYLTTLEDGGSSTIANIDKNDLIYLSADSENTIDEIDVSKVYIIGGIVDKNRYKNLCQDKATEQGIRTARLPIGDYIQMASRKVLTVNHVFEIMSRWLETRDWEKAFLAVIPKRKLPSEPVETGVTVEDEDDLDHADD